MRDRLIELIKNAEKAFPKDKPVLDIEEFVADHLLANGVVVIDTDVVSMPNRPLISQCMGRPIDEVINLIRRSEWISVEDRCLIRERMYSFILKASHVVFIPIWGGTSGKMIMDIGIEQKMRMSPIGCPFPKFRR